MSLIKKLSSAGVISLSPILNSCGNNQPNDYNTVLTPRSNSATEVYFDLDKKSGKEFDYPGTDVFVLSVRTFENPQELMESLTGMWSGFYEEAFFPESFAERLEEKDPNATRIYSKINKRFFLKKPMSDEEFRRLVSNPVKFRDFNKDWYDRSEK